MFQSVTLGIFTGEAELTIFLHLSSDSSYPSLGAKVNFRNSCISKPSHASTSGGLFKLSVFINHMDCENRRWFYQVCNEIQSRLQKNTFWSDLTKDCKTAKRMQEKKKGS